MHHMLWLCTIMKSDTCISERRLTTNTSIKLPSPAPISVAHHSTSHSRSLSLTHGSFPALPLPGDLTGPPLQALDFGSLMQSHDATHAALAHTVDDLAQWLSVVEVGLAHLLDQGNQSTIQEEQEQDGTDDDDIPPSLRQVAQVAANGSS